MNDELEKGLACPKCGCIESTRIQRTMLEFEAKRRYRKCIKCGNTFVTQEFIQIPFKIPKKVKKKP